MRRGLFNTIRRYTEFDQVDKRFTTYIKNCLCDLVVAFVAYDLIEEQLRTTNVYVISLFELQKRMNSLLKLYPRVMMMFIIFQLPIHLGGPHGGPVGDPFDPLASKDRLGAHPGDPEPGSD